MYLQLFLSEAMLCFLKLQCNYDLKKNQNHIDEDPSDQK